MDVRFAQMDEFGDYRQLINICAPPVEDLGSPEISRQMARIGNEALAELVRSHPDRFAGFCACVPMDDPDAAVAELEYATGELGAVGAQIYTHVHGEAMDAARFDPFYEAAARSGSLVQVHPCRSSAWADYPTEQRSRYEIWWTFGWEYDLSAFMARIVFSGVLERYPDLKLLIHHGGSMVPHFSGRVRPGWDQLGARTPPEQQEDIEGYPLCAPAHQYFRQMYGDTAMFGATHALRCCIDFYGTDHILFGSDSPFDPERGPGYIPRDDREPGGDRAHPRGARCHPLRQRHAPDRAHRPGVITRVRPRGCAHAGAPCPAVWTAGQGAWVVRLPGGRAPPPQSSDARSARCRPSGAARPARSAPARRARPPVPWRPGTPMPRSGRARRPGART